MKVTTTFWAPVGAPAGILKVANTVVAPGLEIAVPLMEPARVTPLGTRLSGGLGGVVGRVMVRVTVVPRAALPPGATAVEPVPVPPPGGIIEAIAVKRGQAGAGDAVEAAGLGEGGGGFHQAGGGSGGGHGRGEVRPGAEVGGGFREVSPAFHRTPGEGDVAVRGIDGRGLDFSRGVGAAIEVSGDGFGDGGVASSGAAIILAAGGVRIGGGAIGIQRGEIGPGPAGVFRGDAETGVLLVEVEVRAQRIAAVAEIIEVLNIMPKGVGGADGGAVFEAGSLNAGGPGGKAGASRGSQVGSALRAIAEDEPGDHAADGAGGIEPAGITVGTVKRKPIGSPAEERRVFGEGGGALCITVGDGVVIDVVAQLPAEGDGLGVIVIVCCRPGGRGRGRRSRLHCASHHGSRRHRR